MALEHGFLILDKPIGITSAKAVAEVKRALKCKKIGHGGTLDPLASGILPLAIGEATKAFDYVASSKKSYRFTITFGEERSTDDAEGEVTATTEHIPTRADIEAVLLQFVGTIQQVPPIYSALKIDGKRAYALARAGEQPVMEARPVEVFSLVQLQTPENTFEVTCGKGTYVRSLARDIARKVSSLGYISVLRRTAVGRFTEAAAISLAKLPEFVHNPALFEAWVPIELALDDIPAIDVSSEQALQLRQGQTFGCNQPDGKYLALHDKRPVALVECSNGRLKSQRGFNI